MTSQVLRATEKTAIDVFLHDLVETLKINVNQGRPLKQDTGINGGVLS